MGLSKAKVREYEEALTQHYGEPVRPVSQYCNAFRAWGEAITEKVKELEGDTSEYAQHERERWQKVVDALAALQIPILKSNLLYRLIYLGEELRTEKCPEHRGRWSGYYWERPCECNSGLDVTGWLP